MLLVSTSQGTAGRDVAALVGASLLNLVDSVIREQGSLPWRSAGGAGGGGRDAVHARPGLREHAVRAGQVRGQLRPGHQSLAKLGDLSPTMQDTLLANIGCLAVFQVAGSDARTLVWELGKDRVSEEDITSLPVHHCYVRATVGKERMPAFSMAVRKPEQGDPETAARIRKATKGYTLSPRDISDGDPESQKRMDRFRKGIAALKEDEVSSEKEEGSAGPQTVSGKSCGPSGTAARRSRRYGCGGRGTRRRSRRG